MNHHKVVMVTGAARRIGAELVRYLQQSGMNIILHYRSSEKDATNLADELNAKRDNSVKLVQGDLKEYSQISSLVQQAVSLYGHIDVLINNASSFLPDSN